VLQWGSGARKGVAKIINQEESRAIYMHYYGHALNLAVGDCMKSSKVCKDTLDTLFEITRLVKFSPKRNAAFERIRLSNQDDDSTIGIRTFCHTRWTVRGDAIESILINYNSLCDLWEECLDSPVRLEPDVKARIIGIKTVMMKFNFLFGLKICERILKQTVNLSRVLQKSSLSAAEAQHIASLTVSTLAKIRTDQPFQLFFTLVKKLGQDIGVENQFCQGKGRFQDIWMMAVLVAAFL